jgi:hypothetical protein
MTASVPWVMTTTAMIFFPSFSLFSYFSYYQVEWNDANDKSAQPQSLRHQATSTSL